MLRRRCLILIVLLSVPGATGRWRGIDAPGSGRPRRKGGAMARPAPSVSPPVLDLTPARQPFLAVALHVVTPMFGGSPKAGYVDEEQPIRGGTVRGHLRFWWRACRAHRYTSGERLFADESALWGQTA